MKCNNCKNKEICSAWYDSVNIPIYRTNVFWFFEAYQKGNKKYQRGNDCEFYQGVEQE